MTKHTPTLATEAAHAATCDAYEAGRRDALAAVAAAPGLEGVLGQHRPAGLLSCQCDPHTGYFAPDWYILHLGDVVRAWLQDVTT